MMGSLELQCYGTRVMGYGWGVGELQMQLDRDGSLLCHEDIVVALFLDRIDKMKPLFFFFQLRFCLEFGKDTE